MADGTEELYALADLAALEYGLPLELVPEGVPGLEAAAGSRPARRQRNVSEQRRTTLPRAPQAEARPQRQQLQQSQPQPHQQHQRHLHQQQMGQAQGDVQGHWGDDGAAAAAADMAAEEHLAGLIEPPELDDQGAEPEAEGKRAASYRKMQDAWEKKRPCAYVAYVARHAVPSGSPCDCCGLAAAVVRCLDCKVSVPLCLASLMSVWLVVLVLAVPMDGTYPCRGHRPCCATTAIGRTIPTSTSTGGRHSGRASLSLWPPAPLSRVTTALRRSVSAMPLLRACTCGSTLTTLFVLQVCTSLSYPFPAPSASSARGRTGARSRWISSHSRSLGSMVCTRQSKRHRRNPTLDAIHLC